MREFFRGWRRKVGWGLLAMVLMAYFACDWILLTARKAAKESAQRALLVEVHELVTAYSVAHGCFPKTLEELPFKFPDEGDRVLLRDFHYEAGESKCQIRITLPYTRRIETDTFTLPLP